MSKRKDFRRALQDLINEHSMENGSDTPDYVLARFLSDSLKAFDRATNDREASKTSISSVLSPGTITIKGTGPHGYDWARVNDRTTITNRATVPLTAGSVSALTVGDGIRR